MNTNNILPAEYIVQIDNFYLAELMFEWVYYNQPCSLLFQKPKTEGLTAVRIVVSTAEASEFLHRLKEKTGCRLYDSEKRPLG